MKIQIFFFSCLNNFLIFWNEIRLLRNIQSTINKLSKRKAKEGEENERIPFHHSQNVNVNIVWWKYFFCWFHILLLSGLISSIRFVPWDFDERKLSYSRKVSYFYIYWNFSQNLFSNPFSHDIRTSTLVVTPSLAVDSCVSHQFNLFRNKSRQISFYKHSCKSFV